MVYEYLFINWNSLDVFGRLAANAVSSEVAIDAEFRQIPAGIFDFFRHEHCSAFL